MAGKMCNTGQHADVVYPTTRQSMRLLIKELFGDDERSGFSPFSVRGGDDSLFVEQGESGDEHAVAGRQEHEVKAEGSTTPAQAAVQRTPPKSPSKERESPGKKGTAGKVKPPSGKIWRPVDAEEDDPMSIEGAAGGLDFLSTDEESSNDGHDSSFRFVQQGPDKPTAADRITNDADRVRHIRNNPMIFSQGDRATNNLPSHRFLRPARSQAPAGHDKNESSRGEDLAKGPTSTQSHEMAVKKAGVQNITLGSPACTPTKSKAKLQHPLLKPRATLKIVTKTPVNRVVATPSSSTDKRKRKAREQEQVDAATQSPKRTRHAGSTPTRTREDNSTQFYDDVENLTSEQVRTQDHMYDDPVFGLWAFAREGFDAPLILKGSFQASSSRHAGRDSVTSLDDERQPLEQLLEAGYNVLMEGRGQITDDIGQPEHGFPANCGLDALALAAGSGHGNTENDLRIEHHSTAAALIDLRRGVHVAAPVAPLATDSTSANNERPAQSPISLVDENVAACLRQVRMLRPARASDLESIAIRAIVHAVAQGMLQEWFAADAANMEEGEVQSDDERMRVREDRATTINNLEKFILAHHAADDDPKTTNSLERSISRFERALKKLLSIVKRPSLDDADALKTEMNAEKLHMEHERIGNLLSRQVEMEMSANVGATQKHDPTERLMQDARTGGLIL